MLFLDEPTSGLDPAATRDVVELIGSLATEHGRTVVVCTHFLGEAGRLAHRMAVLHRGRLQAFGRPDELAAELWDGLEADVDLGAPIDDRTLALVRDVDGVTAAAPTADGAHLRVRDRDGARGGGGHARRTRGARLQRGAAHAHARRRLLRDRGRVHVNWPAIRAVMAKDLTAVRRSKAVVLPMLLVPFLLLVVLPLVIGIAARSQDHFDLSRFLDNIPGDLARPILALPQREQLIVLVNGYLLAPLFLIVPLMVSAVLAADAFAGEKERKTLESLLHLPMADRDLFVAKLLTAYVPAVLVSWIGFVCFAIVSNAVAWPVMHRIFIPTRLWGVMIFWVAPAVAALGLSVMVRVSARARTSQEANQLGGAVILPLIFLAVGQATGLAARRHQDRHRHRRPGVGGGVVVVLEERSASRAISSRRGCRRATSRRTRTAGSPRRRSGEQQRQRDRGALPHRRFPSRIGTLLSSSSVNGSRVTGSPACSPSSEAAEPRSTLTASKPYESTTSPTSPVFNAA